jgi:hypothetical protein
MPGNRVRGEAERKETPMTNIQQAEMEGQAPPYGPSGKTASDGS